VQKSWNPFETPSSFQHQKGDEETFNSAFTQIPLNDNGIDYYVVLIILKLI